MTGSLRNKHHQDQSCCTLPVKVSLEKCWKIQSFHGAVKEARKSPGKFSLRKCAGTQRVIALTKK